MMEKGYNHAGLKDILAEAGVPKGSFYHFFENKEQFGLEILDYYARSSAFLITENLHNKKIPALQRLKNFFLASIHVLVKKNKCCGGCLVGNLGQEMADQNPVFREKSEQIMAEWQQEITQCIRQGQLENSINPKVDAKQLASFLFNSWEGAVMRMKISKSDKALNDFMTIVFESPLLIQPSD